MQESPGGHVWHPLGCDQDAFNVLCKAIIHKALEYGILLDDYNIPAQKAGTLEGIRAVHMHMVQVNPSIASSALQICAGIMSMLSSSKCVDSLATYLAAL
jgi:hypothetical protein